MRMKIIGFIGHRMLCDDLIQNLRLVIEKQILMGNKTFILGNHGDFDEMVLKVLREMRKKYNDIKVQVVITGFSQLFRRSGRNTIEGEELYKDEETIMFEIEEEYFKRRITRSNELMIDKSDILICYVDKSRTRSGAKIALKYAVNKGVEIINLYIK